MDRLKLIAEVHKRPDLWDVQYGEYRSRSSLPQLWQEVATCMGPNVTVKECKRNWKNLRDAFRAEIRRIEIRIEKDILRGTYDLKKDYSCKWVYFDHMKFIKDLRKPRRSKMGEVYNHSSNDTYDDNDFAELDEFSELHDINELNAETNAVTSSLKEDTSDNPVHDKELVQQNKVRQTTQKYNLWPPDHSIKMNQDSLKPLKTSEEKPCCKCPKQSFDQMHYLEDLEKEERSLIKSTRLDISRSNHLTHVGNSDYNFLVSFLPQLKKMNELQNLQFRAKMTEFVFRIMCEAPPVSKPN